MGLNGEGVGKREFPVRGDSEASEGGSLMKSEASEIPTRLAKALAKRVNGSRNEYRVDEKQIFP